MKRFVLSLDQLRGAMPKLSTPKATAFLPLIQASIDEFQINDREEVCAYLSTLGHESLDLTKWRENMNYSAERIRAVFKKRVRTMAQAQKLAHNPPALAEAVYGLRQDLGNVRAGDGWKYIARGPIGATGREMYRAAGKALGLPLEDQPDLVEKPEVGFRVSAWIWSVNKRCGVIAKQLRGVADKQEFGLLKEICKRINGGVNGLDDRVTRYERALKAILGDSRPWPEERAPEPEEVSAWLEPTPEATASAQPDFSKLLKKESVKQSAKVASVRGLAIAWRPITLLITAIKAGNWIAISGTVLFVGLLILGVVLYHKEIVKGLQSLGQQVMELFGE